MKILKIESKKGFFYNFKKKNYEDIDLISKESIQSLAEYIMDNDDSEIDPFLEANIASVAQQIIYKNVSSKLIELQSNKKGIIDEINNKFKDKIEKYKG